MSDILSHPFLAIVDLSDILSHLFHGAADLADTVGGLDAELEWSHVLSLGEQQRLAFLRLLLHEPSMAFLDEATGALDSATEASCYRALQKHSNSFISVGEFIWLCCLAWADLCLCGGV